jgi:hypothetical protein
MALMSHLRTAVLAAGATAAGAAVLLPSSSGADSFEVGTGVPEAAPSCPARQCLAVSRTTAFQAKVGTKRGLMTVQKDGRLVSWTISLGKPGTKQRQFFEEKLGGEAEARVVVLKPGPKLTYRVVSQGEPVKLTPHFGKTVEFALERTLRVRKGWVIGLTVPTWAPALARDLPGDTSWRAARERGTCQNTQAQTAARPGTTPQFYCLYRGARVTYSARVVTAPELQTKTSPVAPPSPNLPPEPTETTPTTTTTTPR